MADTVNEIYAQQYGENIMALAQQKASKLMKHVYLKQNVRGKHFFQDQIGEWSMSKKVGRNPNTPSSDPNLARRMAIMENYHDAVMLDRADELKIISDPKSMYTQSGGFAIGRQMDDVIIDALGGDAKTGETGSTTTSLPASQIIVNGSTGLTFAKVKQASRILNENDVEQENRVFVVSPRGIDDLLSVTEATSSDYATLNAIMSGSFDGKTWMGFEWVMSTRLDVASSIRQNFAFHKNGVCAGLPVGPTIRTDERADKSYSWQVYYALDIGATRLEEERVVRVDTYES